MSALNPVDNTPKLTPAEIDQAIALVIAPPRNVRQVEIPELKKRLRKFINQADSTLLFRIDELLSHLPAYPRRKL